MKDRIDRSRPIGAIVIGRAGMDVYPEPDGCKIEDAQRFITDLGGSAGNIAIAIARHGLTSALLSPLSADAVGRFVRATLARYGVDVTRCRVVPGDARTSLALAETRADDCEVVIYRNNAVDLLLSGSDVDEAFIASASVLIVTGTALSIEPSRSSVFQALAAANTAGTFTVLDVDHRSYCWRSTEEAAEIYRAAAQQCSAVVGNDDEFSIMAGAERDPLAVAHGLLHDGKSFVILKNGADGSLTLTQTSAIEQRAFTTKALKPFGAGDAFMGGLISGLLKGSPLAASVAIGSAAAALVVSRRGCASAMPTTADVEAFLSRQA